MNCAELASSLARDASLSEFLERTGIDADDLYRRDFGWARLTVEAGLRVDFREPDEQRLTRGLRRVAHIGDADMIAPLGAC